MIGFLIKLLFFTISDKLFVLREIFRSAPDIRRRITNFSLYDNILICFPFCDLSSKYNSFYEPESTLGYMFFFEIIWSIDRPDNRTDCMIDYWYCLFDTINNNHTCYYIIDIHQTLHENKLLYHLSSWSHHGYGIVNN